MKKILSIAFSLMILLSNVGLAKTIHLCMGMEKESAIGFSTSEIACEMAKKKASCHAENEATSHEKDCCEEEFELLVLDQELQKSSPTIDYSPEFVVSLVYTFLGISISPEVLNSNSTPYLPPHLRQDFQVLHQSFLI